MPTGQLISIFSPESDLAAEPLSLALARGAAYKGQRLILIDCIQQSLTDYLQPPSRSNLTDVAAGRASLEEAEFILAEGGVTYCQAGTAPLGELLGVLAALSLYHDRIVVLAPFGCSAAHVRLASASDASLMLFHTQKDRFMRAYWMLDAIRQRAPHYDPLIIAEKDPKDSPEQAHESYHLYKSVVQDFLGAPPRLADIIDRQTLDTAQGLTILDQLNEVSNLAAAA